MGNRLLRMASLICLAAMIVILSGCGGPKGSIEGYVYIPEGAAMDRLAGGREIPAGNQPVPNATVTCSGYKGSVKTDSSGYFRMDRVTIGTQTVTMTRSGFGVATATVDVLEGQVSAITADEGLLKKKWTMLVYMDADNNLGDPDSGGQINDCALLDINEMEQVGSTDDVNVVVQWDRPSYHTSWTTTRRYYITKGSTYDVDSKMLVDLGEQDMSDPETLKSFLVWGMTNYPADHYVVVLWNHGDGISPRTYSRSRQSRGIGWDDTTGIGDFYCLTTDELKTAFSGAEALTGSHIEVLDFDACLMNMAEVAYGLNGIFDYIVGSEEITPGTGNPYTDILENLTQNPDQTAREYAIMKAQLFGSAYRSYDGGVTSSALDVTDNKVTTLANAMNSFAQAVYGSSTKEAVALAAIASDVERYYSYEYVDIGLLMDRVINAGAVDVSVKAAASNVKAALADLVMARYNTGGYMGQGLSVLLPPSRNQWRNYESGNRYPSTEFAVNNTSWVPMILALLPRESTLTSLLIKATWDENVNCDLEILEPDGLWRSAYILDPYMGVAFSTYNGDYSANSTGGPGAQESFALKAKYETGLAGYAFRVVNCGNSSAQVTVTVTKNGVDQVYSYTVGAWQDAGPVTLTVD